MGLGASPGAQQTLVHALLQAWSGNVSISMPQCMIPLQTIDIIRFREQLELESETTQRMSSSRLIAMCKER